MNTPKWVGRSRTGKLKSEARKAASFRGHTMQPFEQLAEGNEVSHCFVCDAEVQVLTNPAPNQIAIGGRAVAVDCENTLENALAILSSWAIRGHRQGNPYCKLEVEQALRVLAKIRGRADWMDAA